jgi:hypothetical protein
VGTTSSEALSIASKVIVSVCSRPFAWSGVGVPTSCLLRAVACTCIRTSHQGGQEATLSIGRPTISYYSIPSASHANAILKP